MDFANITQLDKPFSAEEIFQDGYAAGRLTNLEIDNYGNVNAGYSNGQNVALGIKKNRSMLLMGYLLKISKKWETVMPRQLLFVFQAYLYKVVNKFM